MPIEIADSGHQIYRPDGAVLRAYLQGNKHVEVIRGPIGSGSSSGSCLKIWKFAIAQRVAPDGLRHSRWGVVRNSYPELKNTTVKTWLDWFPEEQYGRLYLDKPMRQTIRVGDVDLEVFFLALDQPDDVRKMRSLEVTGWWFNELEFTPKEIFDEAESRTGRYPSVKDGGSAWDGVIADMNAPSEDHWLPMMTGEAPYPDEVQADDRKVWPADWGYHVQPPALIEEWSGDGKQVIGYHENPEAENRHWLKPGYYEEKMRGKSKNWIDSRLMNRIVFVADGDPVWPMYRDEVHCAKAMLQPVPGHEVIVALDFGRRPTALCGQEIANRDMFQYEFRMFGVGAATFAPALKRFLEQKYAGFKLRFVGDPKGQDRGQADERSAYEIFEANGMRVTPAPVKNNHLETRLSAVEYVLNDMWMGLPRFVLSPACMSLRAALSGRYRMKKVAGEAEPIKDKYSDIADCLQYWCLFVGEGRRMVGLEAARHLKATRVSGRGRSMRRVS